jgi:hypothetical protein
MAKPVVRHRPQNTHVSRVSQPPVSSTAQMIASRGRGISGSDHDAKSKAP